MLVASFFARPSLCHVDAGVNLIAQPAALTTHSRRSDALSIFCSKQVHLTRQVDLIPIISFVVRVLQRFGAVTVEDSPR
ncbi:MAG: hypothetical protein RLZZ232_652 [Planctomycetota bacterium]